MICSWIALKQEYPSLQEAFYMEECSEMVHGISIVLHSGKATSPFCRDGGVRFHQIGHISKTVQQRAFDLSY